MLTETSAPLHVLESSVPGEGHLHVVGPSAHRAACGCALDPGSVDAGGVTIGFSNHERLCLKNGCREPLVQWLGIHLPELCRRYQERVAALEAARRRRPRAGDGEQGALF